MVVDLNITTVNLSDGQLKELRVLGVENVSELMRQLIQAHIRKLRGSNKEFITKRKRILERLEKLRVEWWQVELARAKKAPDEAAIKHYEKLLRGAS